MKVSLSRKRLAQRSGGRCEVCGLRPAREAQHRKNRSQGGTWDLSNLIHVCGHGNTDGCHGFIHQHPDTAYANGWSVRQARTPAEIPAWLTTEYGQIYVWLHDDGSKSPVDIAELIIGAIKGGTGARPDELAGLLFGAEKAEIIHERGTA